MSKLKIMCTGDIEVNYHGLKDLQLTKSKISLKLTDDSKIKKLAKSLCDYGVITPLQVWCDGKNTYCFDAHHRKKALELLENEGVFIPNLPATKCLAKTKAEAKKLLLLKESVVSWVNTAAIIEYINDIDFDLKLAEEVLDIPNFDFFDADIDLKDAQKYIDKYSVEQSGAEGRRSDDDCEKIKMLVYIPEKIKKETEENFRRRGIKFEVI